MDSNYFRAVIEHIVQGLRDVQSDQQIANRMKTAGLRSPTNRLWTGCNVGNVLAQLRHEHYPGVWNKALQELVKDGKIVEDQVTTLKKFRPQPINQRSKPVKRPDFTEAIKAIVEAMPRPFTFGDLKQEMIDNGVPATNDQTLSRIVTSAGFVARRIKAGGVQRWMFDRADVPTRVVKAKLYADTAPVSKYRGYVVYLDATRVIGVQDFDNANDSRMSYATACVQLVENGGVGQFNGKTFNSVQKHLP